MKRRPGRKRSGATSTLWQLGRLGLTPINRAASRGVRDPDCVSTFHDIPTEGIDCSKWSSVKLKEFFSRRYPFLGSDSIADMVVQAMRDGRINGGSKGGFFTAIKAISNPKKLSEPSTPKPALQAQNRSAKKLPHAALQAARQSEVEQFLMSEVHRIAREAWLATVSLPSPTSRWKAAKDEVTYLIKFLTPRMRSVVKRRFVATGWSPLLAAAKAAPS